MSIPLTVSRSPVHLCSSQRCCQRSRARLQNSGACVPDREVSCADRSSWKELTLPSVCCARHWRSSLNWMENGCCAITPHRCISCQSPFISNCRSLDSHLHKGSQQKHINNTKKGCASGDMRRPFFAKILSVLRLLAHAARPDERLPGLTRNLFCTFEMQARNLLANALHYLNR